MTGYNFTQANCVRISKELKVIQYISLYLIKYSNKTTNEQDKGMNIYKRFDFNTITIIINSIGTILC